MKVENIHNQQPRMIYMLLDCTTPEYRCRIEFWVIIQIIISAKRLAYILPPHYRECLWEGMFKNWSLYLQSKIVLTSHRVSSLITDSHAYACPVQLSPLHDSERGVRFSTSFCYRDNGWHRLRSHKNTELLRMILTPLKREEDYIKPSSIHPMICLSTPPYYHLFLWVGIKYSSALR